MGKVDYTLHMNSRLREICFYENGRCESKNIRKIHKPTLDKAYSNGHFEIVKFLHHEQPNEWRCVFEQENQHMRQVLSIHVLIFVDIGDIICISFGTLDSAMV
jgi:hypothetical protein